MPQQASPLAAENDPLEAAASNPASTATTSPSIGQSNAVLAVPAAPPVFASNPDQSAAESASGGDDLAERPLGWCFRTWSGPAGPWLAVSPPGEPTHELRSDSRVVWNGSRSAWLGIEAQQPAGPSRPFHYDFMWQTIDATPYRASRIELSAQSRGAGMVHLFLRTQRATEKELVLIGPPPQNYRLHLHSGDSWARLTVVADVPADADVIVVGVGVWNRGHAWIDDARLVKVATSTPLTNNPLGEVVGLTMPPAYVEPFDVPTNLDFEATELDSTGVPLQLAGC